MIRRHRFGPSIFLGLLLIGLSGCGGGSSPQPPPPAGADSPNAPRLLTDAASSGEHVFSADLSPKSFGPVTLNGSYTVRFAQYAPEDADMDFSTKTVFMAKLIKVSGPGPKEVPLFLEAARAGRTQVTVEGNYRVEVTFGDFPFVVRLTPA